jgi:hypothetical protein
MIKQGIRHNLTNRIARFQDFEREIWECSDFCVSQ